MARTFQQFLTLIRNNITDPLLRQNTAKRMREVMESFAADYFNKQSDTLQINQVLGLQQALDARGVPYTVIVADASSQIPNTDLNNQNQYNAWIIGFLRLLASNIASPMQPDRGHVDDIGDTFSVPLVAGYSALSDYQGFSPYTGGTQFLNDSNAYIQNGWVYLKNITGPANIATVGIGVAASGGRPAGPFRTNEAIFTGTPVVTPGGDTINPNISFIAPASGAIIAPNTDITLTVNATDNVAVSGVSFTNGGTGAAIGAGAKNGNTYTAPYKTGAAGQLILVATAVDAAGNSQTATVTITIQAATPISYGETLSISKPISNGGMSFGTPGNAKLRFDDLTNTSGATISVAIIAAGVTSYLDYYSEFAGKPYEFEDDNSIKHTGNFPSSDTTINF